MQKCGMLRNKMKQHVVIPCLNSSSHILWYLSSLEKTCLVACCPSARCHCRCTISLRSGVALSTVWVPIIKLGSEELAFSLSLCISDGLLRKTHILNKAQASITVYMHSRGQNGKYRIYSCLQEKSF